MADDDNEHHDYYKGRRMWSVEEVAKEVSRIAATDQETDEPHKMRDALMLAVLESIAGNWAVGDYAAKLAAEVLKVEELNFPRWYS